MRWKLLSFSFRNEKKSSDHVTFIRADFHTTLADSKTKLSQQTRIQQRQNDRPSNHPSALRLSRPPPRTPPPPPLQTLTTTPPASPDLPRTSRFLLHFLLFSIIIIIIIAFFNTILKTKHNRRSCFTPPRSNPTSPIRPRTTHLRRPPATL